MKKVFFHSDLDGYTAGSIVSTVFNDCQFIECNYDNRINPLKYLQRGDDVIVVDYSFLPDEMIRLREQCNLTWIDHHISAIDDSVKYGYEDVKGLREIGLSGAELTWKFYYGDSIPEFVQLVGDYDTFRSYGKNRFNKTVLPFFFGAEMFLPGLNPKNQGKEFFLFEPEKLQSLAKKFIRLGEVVYRYKKMAFSKINRDNAFVRKIWDLRVLCLNTCEIGSLCLTLPKTFDPQKHDMILCYNFNGEKWSYGFYTNDHPEVDCSKIARIYGGGGHRCAAGAVTNHLLEELR